MLERCFMTMLVVHPLGAFAGGATDTSVPIPGISAM